MVTLVTGFFADQGSPQAYGTAKQFTTKPSKLYYLTAHNSSGATVYIELYDSASAASGTPRVLPCLGTDSVSGGAVVGWAQLKMTAGIYVRAVSSLGGAIIGSNDVKFDCGFTDEIV